MNGFKVGTGGGCCCDFDCTTLFLESFDGEEPIDGWTNPENLTINGDGTATLAANTSVSIVPGLTNGSGRLVVAFKLASLTDRIIIRFAYKDANNHWRLEVYFDTDPSDGVGNAQFSEWYRIRAGVEEYIGTRFEPQTVTNCLFSATFHTADLCWLQGKRTYGTTCSLLEWPTGITGGNRFEIEAGDADVVLFGVTLNPNHLDECPCNTFQCMTCAEELGDTIDIEIMDGPLMGDVYVADRYRDWPYYPPFWPTYVQPGALSYWHYLTPPYSAVDEEYYFHLAMCAVETTAPYLQIIETPSFVTPLVLKNTFEIEDCEGPWDVVVPVTFHGDPFDYTYRVTP